MDSIRAYKFRIYPDAKRQSEINFQLILSKNLYNKLLEKAISAYQKDKKSKLNMSALNKMMKEAIEENKDFLKIYSQTRQNIFIRLQKSYQNFFRRCKEKKSGKKQKVGFPRFKSRDKYYSIVYPQNNGSFHIEKERKTDMLRVSRIGRMKIDLHRQMEGKIKTLTIKKDANQYYAVFTTIQENEIPEIKDTNPVGIDLGLNNFMALSNGKTIQKPKFFKKKAKRIARWQRIVARRTKWEGKKMAKMQSKNREKAKAHLSQEWINVTHQSNDFAHKLSNYLVNSGYTSFVVEKLNIRNMVKNHKLAQSIHNASWNRCVGFLSYKAESAGKKKYEVNPDNTTQECSSCHNIKKGKEKLTLKDRIYNCFVCGLVIDRDINASINILNRAREGHSRSNASGDATSTIQQVSQVASMNQEHTLHPMVAGEAHTL